jgi:leader peptidase (prepilin peptidase)/N-methyltransferase
MLLIGAAFVLGAVIGSFLNVCIRRLPAGESVVRPPSHCPHCGVRIRSRDNIPLLSYVLLRGRCRSCGAAIGLRYLMVEALTGVMLSVLVWRFDLSVWLIPYGIFAAALIVISFIDLDHQIIPDVISLPGIAVGLLFAAVGCGPPLLASVLGVLLGGGSLWAVAIGYHAFTGREGMGGGDIKMLAMIGAFLGWRGVLVTLLVGSFTGALVGVTLMVARGADSRIPIPFGPFLALGGVCALFCGDALVQWYLRLALLA